VVGLQFSIMNPKLRIAAITDEFSPDLAAALPPMKEIGMTGAELRVVFGKNIMDLNEDELKRAENLLAEFGMEVISIASPILKCEIPNGPAIDSRFQQDMFNSKHTYADQPRLLDHAFGLAKRFKAPIIRVFSYWRTVDPVAVLDRVYADVQKLGEQAAKENLIIGLENEHACHIGTAAEAAAALQAIASRNVQLVWDPANALVGGEEPFPFGYNLLPKDRIAHVHAKDCHMEGHTPIWGPLGTRAVDWHGQVAGLLRDGYTGWLSLETHWPGPSESAMASGATAGTNKMMASYICGWNLRGLAAS
jgi:L-ribulose-5-phosphate 3-epimerase